MKEFQNGGFFGEIPKPSHIDDWLAQYVPTNQDFRTWELTARKHKFATSDRQTIYLAPIGELGKNAPSLNSLREYTEAFFHPLKVQVLDTLKIVSRPNSTQRPKKKARNAKLAINGIHIEYTDSDGEKKTHVQQVRRCHEYYVDELPEDHRQFAVDPILDVLEYILPGDAICLLGITMEDLFEGNTDNFTVGMATGPKDRIGIFSFARYDPEFEEKPSKKSTAQAKQNKAIFLQRSCKVLAHEILHMFGVDHCVWHDCMMNGSGWLEEDFNQSYHLCPIDLRKLLHCTKAAPVAYYTKLLEFYEKQGIVEEASWVKKRLGFLNAPHTEQAIAEEPPRVIEKEEVRKRKKPKTIAVDNDQENKKKRGRSIATTTTLDDEIQPPEPRRSTRQVKSSTRY